MLLAHLVIFNSLIARVGAHIEPKEISRDDGDTTIENVLVQLVLTNSHKLKHDYLRARTDELSIHKEAHYFIRFQNCIALGCFGTADAAMLSICRYFTHNIQGRTIPSSAKAMIDNTTWERST